MNHKFTSRIWACQCRWCMFKSLIYWFPERPITSSLMWSSDVQNTNAELIPVPCLLVILLLVLIRSIKLVRVDSSLHYDTILLYYSSFCIYITLRVGPYYYPPLAVLYAQILIRMCTVVQNELNNNKRKKLRINCCNMTPVVPGTKSKTRAAKCGLHCQV